MTTVGSEEIDPVVRASRRAAESFRASARVLALLSAMLPDTDEGNALEETKKRLEQEFNALVLQEGTALDDAVRRIESDVLKFERDLEALDRSIPMGWFREHFDASQASSVALADYASLLGRYVGDSPLRLDRIQFLLTRVVSFFMAPEDASTGRRIELLGEALPRVEVDETARDTAVAFLHDAARRVSSFSRMNEVIASGFFVDIRGYKLSLRQQLLDPAIMAAAIELNEAVNDNMRRLAEADAPAGKEMEAHLAEVDAHIKSIFTQLREDETATQQQFVRWLARNAEKRLKGAPKPTAFTPAGKKKKSAKLDRRVVLSVILLLAIAITWARWPGGALLKELSKAELAQLSPLLVSGTVAPAKNPRIFVGQVDKSRWALLPLAERRQAAESLSLALGAHGWFSGTVMLEQQVVIQVEQGQLLIVQ